MKCLFAGILFLAFTGQPQFLNAADVSALQLLFTAKKVFPQASEVNVLIPARIFSEKEETIKRATVQTGLEPTIYIIEHNRDIGSGIRKMSDSSVLILLGEELLSASDSKLFILSKCKEKKISLISSSKGYSDSGALLGVLKDTDQKINLVLNLKHNRHLLRRFTPDVIAEMGIKQVIK